MDLEGKQVLRVTIPEFERVKNKEQDEVYFLLHVTFGTHQRWITRRSYKEFAAFNTKCEQKFGSDAVPYFTGSIPFNYRSAENSEKRRFKLEEYVIAVLLKWPEWRPTQGLVVKMPHPDGLPDNRAKVHLFLLKFLEVDINAVVVDRGEEYELELKRKKEAEEAAAAENAEEARQRKVQAGEMSEVQAYQERLKAEGLLAAAPADEDADVKRKADEAAAAANKKKAGGGTAAAKSKAAKEKKEKKAKAGKPAEADVDVFSDSDGFDVIVERDNTKTKSDLRKFTSHARVRCRDYRLIPNSHIEYNFQIAICGATWTLSKRYSDVEKFHEAVVKVYGEAQTDVLPDFSEAFAPKWAKMDEDVAVKRQAFFTRYFEKLVGIIDRWRPMNKKLEILKPIELNKTSALSLADNSSQRSRNSFMGDTSGATEAALNALAQDDELHVVVDVNALIYEYFGFEERLKDFDADKAAEVQKEKEAALPQTLRVDLERERAVEAAKIRAANFQKRQKERPGMLRDEEVEDFARVLGSFDDDSEALRLVISFVTDGYYTAVPRAVNLMKLAEAKSAGSDFAAAGSPLLGASQSISDFDSLALRKEAEKKIGTAPVPCCITSRGLADLIKPVAFDDTKANIIKAMARVLSDDVHLSEALDGLMYDWEEVEQEVVAALSKPDVPVSTALEY